MEEQTGVRGLVDGVEIGKCVSACRPAYLARGSSPGKRVFGTAIRESFADDASLGCGVRRAQHASRRIG
tara:strand:- start:346 stop:552 length:207 start_codon:yes stop_codon:yes gene_type:complete